MTPRLTRRLAATIATIALLSLLPTTLPGAPSMDTPTPSAIACDITHKVDPRGASVTHAGWQDHAVVRMGGGGEVASVTARFLFLSGTWGFENAQMPYLVYLPEAGRLLLSAEVGAAPVHTVLCSSDDLGATWSEPRWMHTDAAGAPVFTCVTGLAGLGAGRLMAASDTYWFSDDAGQTWGRPVPVPKGSEGKPMYQWDPVLVERDPHTGEVTRLIECRYKENGTFDTPEYFSQACVHFSTDGGSTWSKEIEVPQWRGVNEVALARAANGDIVAACRTDNPKQFIGRANDQYSGLATSVSRDGGITWSPLETLYWWGRHHPCMVTHPNGDMVLTYVVRNGYTDAADGFPRFGVEAVVSRDNGQTWDLDHKYILASWTAKVRGTWWGSPQSTSTLLLPDGTLLTAFGTGLRNVPEQSVCKMDVALVSWRLSDEPVDAVRTIRDAPFDSDLRNLFNLDLAR